MGLWFAVSLLLTKNCFDAVKLTPRYHRYFKSKFHCFDAAVIIAGFVVDVCLKGLLEEVGSIVVVLRLWRVFKIIEEFSAGAEEEMDAMTEKIEQLQQQNEELKKEMTALKGK